MKAFLRHILINLLVIYLADLIYPGLFVDQSLKTLSTAAIIWLLLNKIVKPIIKILLLPINLITLNLFSWMVGLLTLFLLQVFADGIRIESYTFPGINYSGFALPSFYFNLFFSYLITSILLNSLHVFILWLIRKDTD